MLLQKKSFGQTSPLSINRQTTTKQNKETQEQLSSPLSQGLKTDDFGNFDNCELNSEII